VTNWIEIANRLDLEVFPEDVTELLQSYSQDLKNEDIVEIEEQGIVEEDEDEQDVAWKLLLPLNLQFRDLRRHSGTSNQQWKFSRQMTQILNAVRRSLKQ
jgi:hypothetical protein